jgi:two-component system sensor histidine kinase QseC
VIRCWTTASDGTVNILIDDNGPGIPEDELPKVRDRFFRGRNKTPVGSGLGLSIVELALARAKGQLTIENRPEGGLRAVIRMQAAPKNDDNAQVVADPVPHRMRLA